MSPKSSRVLILGSVTSVVLKALPRATEVAGEKTVTPPPAAGEPTKLEPISVRISNKTRSERGA